MESTYSSGTNIFGQWTRCAERHPLLFRSLGSFDTSRRFAKRTTGHSKIEPPFSRIRSTSFFDDTDWEAYEVALDWGTNDLRAL